MSAILFCTFNINNFVQVPGQFLSWKKSKQYIFGINQQGVIKIDTFSGKVCFQAQRQKSSVTATITLIIQVLSVKRFSDVHSGRCRENVIHLVRCRYYLYKATLWVLAHHGIQ